MKPDEQLVEFLRKEYLDVKVLEDGSIAAIGQLLYTTAIYLDVDRWGYGDRFCFEDKDLAMRRFNELRNANEVPEGCIAMRKTK